MVFRLTLQLVIFLLLAGAIVLPTSIPSRSTPRVQAQVIGPGVCHGDELITFAPTRPTVGGELRIAVTSATPHRGVYLAGNEPVGSVSETQGQLGVVWLWSLIPQLPGSHTFQFFAEFTKFCAEATIEVAPSPLSTVGAALTPGSTAIDCSTPSTTVALAAPGYASSTAAVGAYPLGPTPPTLTPSPTPFTCPTPTFTGAAPSSGVASPGLAAYPTPYVYPPSDPLMFPTPFADSWDSNDNGIGGAFNDNSSNVNSYHDNLENGNSNNDNDLNLNSNDNGRKSNKNDNNLNGNRNDNKLNGNSNDNASRN